VTKRDEIDLQIFQSDYKILSKIKRIVIKMKEMNAEEAGMPQQNVILQYWQCLTIGWNNFQVSPFGSQPLGDGRDYELQHQGMVMLPGLPTPT
jgi:hypothetical protein